MSLTDTMNIKESMILSKCLKEIQEGKKKGEIILR